MEQDTNTTNQFIRGDGFCFLNNVNAIKITHFYHKLYMKNNLRIITQKERAKNSCKSDS
jgi:hypothetical protein